MGAAGSKLEKALGDQFPEGERYFGLENFGNTCYCNSVLQALYFCVPFREQLIEYYSNNKNPADAEENLLTCLADLFLQVKKLQREKRLDAIVDRNLNKNYNIQEVEMMIQVALLCTQSSPEDRPAMSEVVRMLEGEGLAERWEEWQHVEVTRRQEYERLQRRFDWGEDSVYNQDAIELSGGR